MSNAKLSIHKIFTIIYLIAALLTLVPCNAVSKVSLLGYKALCSWSPISTIILISLGILHIFLNKKK